MSECVYLERIVAEVTGLSPKHLKSVRKTSLKQGTDWERSRDGITLSEEALDKVLGLLGVKLADSGATGGGQLTIGDIREKAHSGALRGTHHAESAATPCTAVVPHVGPRRLNLTYGPREHALSQNWKNPHILAAELHGQLQQVKVRNKDNFRPGMELPCLYLHDNFWKLDRRGPRRPGRW